MFKNRLLGTPLVTGLQVESAINQFPKSPAILPFLSIHLVFNCLALKS